MIFNTPYGKYSCIFLILLLSTKIYSNDTIVVNAGMYHIDAAKHLIVVNQNLEQLNALAEGELNAIQLNQTYSFDSPVSQLEIGTKHPVVNSEGERYKLYFTQLPIIDITTSNQVVDDPRVFAKFQLTSDTGRVITSNIGIEYRGNLSQTFPKGSYRVEFWNDTIGVETKNVRLLGMRNDDDWNLQAMYNEPLRFKNKTCFNLWNRIDTLSYLAQEPDAVNGIRCEYVELFFNNEYRGIYCLGERIDRKQLKLCKSENGTMKGELYKSQNSTDVTQFRSAPDFDNSNIEWEGFIMKYPNNFIEWGNLHNLANFIANTDSITFYANYDQWINVDNAVNFYLFINIIEAVDNMDRNVYTARYNQNSAYFFNPWDFDASFGYFIFGERRTDWPQMDISNTLFDRLLMDTRFKRKLKERWTLLREDFLNISYIMGLFEKHYNYLLKNGIYEREAIAWNKYQFDDTALDYITNWTDNRLIYLDGFFNVLEVSTNTINQQKVEIENYPNPFRTITTICYKLEQNSNVKLTVYDAYGREIKTLVNQSQRAGEYAVQFDGSTLPNGIYYYGLSSGDFKKVNKMILIK